MSAALPTDDASLASPGIFENLGGRRATAQGRATSIVCARFCCLIACLLVRACAGGVTCAKGVVYLGSAGGAKAPSAITHVQHAMCCRVRQQGLSHDISHPLVERPSHQHTRERSTECRGAGILRCLLQELGA